MFKLKNRLFVQRTHVKPASLTEDSGWTVKKMNIFQNLFDDFKRYGLKIAVRNFLTIILH